MDGDGNSDFTIVGTDKCLREARAILGKLWKFSIENTRGNSLYFDVYYVCMSVDD